MLRMIAIALALLLFGANSASAQTNAEKRIALVIGNAGYQAGALTTTANDAGLIAQTLQAAGFDVAGARDLDQDSLRRALRDFVEKATASGPDTVAYIYFAGYGLQLEGENYIIPVDARIARDADIPIEAVRISDYTRPLAGLKLKATIVILDAARGNSFAKSGQPIAGGLALVEPEPGMLLAFNAAPGTIAPEGQGPYGPYAQSLAEMMRDGGLPLGEVFDRVRLRVNDITKGAELPWHAGRIEAQFVFFERAPDAPPPAAPVEQAASLRRTPIRNLAAQEAYTVALERDTLQGYTDFLAAFPRDPMAKRVRAIVAARREAITWRRTRAEDTPPAYWSYLRRYPHGPHAADAHRRLAFLSAALEPPPSFAMISYDVPPPPPEEIVYVAQPVLAFDDPVYAFDPPPPPPVFLLPPPDPEFVVLPPPPPPIALFVLPMPEYRPVPIWVRPPRYIAPPPHNVIYANVHNTVVINNTTNTVTVTDRSGQRQTITPTAQPAAQSPAPGAAPTRDSGAAPVAAVGPALPPSLAQKAAAMPTQTAPAAKPPITGPQPQVQPGQVQPGQTTATQPGQAAPGAPTQQRALGAPLPGGAGQPLPTPNTATKGAAPGTATAPSGAAPLTAAPGPTAPGATKVGPAGAKAAKGAPPAAATVTPQAKPSLEKKEPAGKSVSPSTLTTKQTLQTPPQQKLAPAPPPSMTRPAPKAPVVTAKPAPSAPPPVAARPLSAPPAAAKPAAPPPPRVAAPPPPSVRAPGPPTIARPSPPPPTVHAPPPAAMRAPPPAAIARPAPPPAMHPPPQAMPRPAMPPPQAMPRPAAPPPAAAARRPACAPGQPCPR